MNKKIILLPIALLALASCGSNEPQSSSVAPISSKAETSSSKKQAEYTKGMDALTYSSGRLLNADYDVKIQIGEQVKAKASTANKKAQKSLLKKNAIGDPIPDGQLFSYDLGGIDFDGVSDLDSYQKLASQYAEQAKNQVKTLTSFITVLDKVVVENDSKCMISYDKEKDTVTAIQSNPFETAMIQLIYDGSGKEVVKLSFANSNGINDIEYCADSYFAVRSAPTGQIPNFIEAKKLSTGEWVGLNYGGEKYVCMMTLDNLPLLFNDSRISFPFGSMDIANQEQMHYYVETGAFNGFGEAKLKYVEGRDNHFINRDQSGVAYNEGVQFNSYNSDSSESYFETANGKHVHYGDRFNTETHEIDPNASPENAIINSQSNISLMRGKNGDDMHDDWWTSRVQYAVNIREGDFYKAKEKLNAYFDYFGLTFKNNKIQKMYENMFKVGNNLKGYESYVLREMINEQPSHELPASLAEKGVTYMSNLKTYLSNQFTGKPTVNKADLPDRYEMGIFELAGSGTVTITDSGISVSANNVSTEASRLLFTDSSYTVALLQNDELQHDVLFNDVQYNNEKMVFNSNTTKVVLPISDGEYSYSLVLCRKEGEDLLPISSALKLTVSSFEEFTIKEGPNDDGVYTIHTYSYEEGKLVISSETYYKVTVYDMSDVVKTYYTPVINFSDLPTPSGENPKGWYYLDGVNEVYLDDGFALGNNIEIHAGYDLP